MNVNAGIRTEIDLNECEIDLNECEHLLKANLDRSEILSQKRSECERSNAN